MKVWAISDIHVDFDANLRWVLALSNAEYREDVLILAGDLTDSISLLDRTLRTLVARFRKVLFVPGNHDLWVVRDRHLATSFAKFQRVAAVVEASGASMQPFTSGDVTVVPLLSWYDYSFGMPGPELLEMWADYRACRWPEGFLPADICDQFHRLNHSVLGLRNRILISFSHFLPRIDLMPQGIPELKGMLFPVLGSLALERQLRLLKPGIHIYGHSHVNRSVELDGITYINNAFGYPDETDIAARVLRCVYDSALDRHTA